MLGNGCHDLLEYCVKKEVSALKLTPKIIKRLVGDLKISEKNLDDVELYRSYITSLIPEYDKTYAERTYDLQPIYDADIGGTADITQVKRRGFLHIGDYKNGFIRVDVEGNTQTRIYALGAYYEFNSKYKFKKILISIGQPNSWHPSGAIRTEILEIDELKEWKKRL